jgi:hypothetical protein
VSPTSRSIEFLSKLGFKCLYVEVPNRHLVLPDGSAFTYKSDLFGWCDVLALKPKRRLLVQCTSISNIASRIKKIQCSEWFEWVKQAEFEVYVHGWETNTPRSRIVDMTSRDLEGNFIYPTLWNQIFAAKLAKKHKARPQKEMPL